MKIIAAQPPGDVNGFADRIEVLDAFGHHCLRGQPGGGDSADRDLGFGKAFGAVGVERPTRETRFGVGEFAVGLRRELAGKRKAIGQRFGESVGEVVAERGA